MIVFRRRLLMWLIKAYIKRWGRLFLIFFLLGLVGFFILRYAALSLPSVFPLLSRQTVGLTGTYTLDNLPPSILSNISRGLTSVSMSGQIRPDIAYSWKIDDNGKKYTFKLKNNIYFSDGTHLTSKLVNYNFKDAKVERPDDYTLIYRLNDAYSPFLVTVSRPIFKKGFVGLGSYRVRDLKLNGEFVSSIDLSSDKNSPKILKYVFYPTEEALKIAFVLGEISEASGLHDLKFEDRMLDSFKSVKVQRRLSSDQLVTVFFNTSDPSLSEKKLRKALSFSSPDQYPQGQKNIYPFSPSSWVQSEEGFYTRDIDQAKELIKESEASKSSSLKFVMKTLPQYMEIAKILKENYKKININIEIEEVNSVPDRYQIFLGDFKLSKDPDQYLLWHSNQNTNISNYKNLRIDKLLEDGRKISNIDERKKIYSDFQKYLLDDAPATFLYLPYTYTVTRD